MAGTKSSRTTINRRIDTPATHWAWPEGTETQALRVGNTVYVGGQVSLSREGKLRDAGSIEAQTANVFSALVAMLEAGGATMKDLVKLHTYYVFEGDGRGVTDYWERMTQVRLRYLANPGPAATALRVAGAPFSSALIAVDGVAVVDTPKQRIMPKHTWDWSIPTPFSQGWKAGNKVYVGGQISADMAGRAVAAGNGAEQTRNVLELIRHVLLDGGAGWEDLVTMRICYQHTDKAAGAALREQIMHIVGEVLPTPGPAITAFGANLLYEGLLLEIDATAVCGVRRSAIAGSSAGNDRFPSAWQVGPELYFSVGGAAGNSAAEQLPGVLDALGALLEEAKGEPAQLVKLTAFYIADGDAEAVSSGLRRAIRSRFPAPVLTLVHVAALPAEGQCLEIDGVSVAP